MGTAMKLAICVMAKAPAPGRVKTRLCPPLSHDEAADLASAFLIDVWRAAANLQGVTTLLSYHGNRNEFPAELNAVHSFPQRDGDLGARIEHTARTGLEHGDMVLVIGSDLPGLSAPYLQTARNTLLNHDAVLGPSRDGGFYLIGMRQCPVGLLADLPWSAPQTHQATLERLVERGYDVAHAPRFDDVDTVEDLTALRNGIVAGSLLAPASARVLSRLTCI